ncbi:hypothetical protein H257_17538 [Aphanomyces astaci]|uniref:Uncharacterized protein n=1 Tax=Aphanomyces astaci TaxID=112090 RepID=W4FGL5_APHAT|nr:hypothetical protein H257_17538 [Aphanomyces astaci]ETV65903.1 hypothetical protein H257_17538 [Aphanomyces astaci]|eukprot:XP_009844656.1 hypothetical protein H257_17538 [Aphanomyces astaci]
MPSTLAANASSPSQPQMGPNGVTPLDPWSEESPQTLRALANKSDVPKTTIIRHMKDAARLKARLSYVKPFLTLENIRERLRNDYKLPHMKKDALISDFTAFNVECDAYNYESALIHLNYRLGEEASMEVLVNSQEQSLVEEE